MNPARGPVGRDMATFAPHEHTAIVGRTAFVGGFLLALVVWLQCQPPLPSASALVSLEHVRRPPVIVPMELYAEPEQPGLIKQLVDALTGVTYPDAVAPPPHPDAQPWPRGMVITPKPFPDRMATDIPTSLDRALSALLSPWLTTAS
jgi:hypothetical protein